MFVFLVMVEMAHNDIDDDSPVIQAVVTIQRFIGHGVTSLLWNDIKLSWKHHLLEHLFQIFHI